MIWMSEKWHPHYQHRRRGAASSDIKTVCKVMLRICKLNVVVLADTSKYNKITKQIGGFYDVDL